jgi:hypothetical protein
MNTYHQNVIDSVWGFLPRGTYSQSDSQPALAEPTVEAQAGGALSAASPAAFAINPVLGAAVALGGMGLSAIGNFKAKKAKKRRRRKIQEKIQELEAQRDYQTKVDILSSIDSAVGAGMMTAQAAQGRASRAGMTGGGAGMTGMGAISAQVAATVGAQIPTIRQNRERLMQNREQLMQNRLAEVNSEYAASRKAAGELFGASAGLGFQTLKQLFPA